MCVEVSVVVSLGVPLLNIGKLMCFGLAGVLYGWPLDTFCRWRTNHFGCKYYPKKLIGHGLKMDMKTVKTDMKYKIRNMM
jgi:hypothetical protein